MRILYIHQYFKTPQEGGAIRSWYIATAMVKAGHEVVMVTSHNEDNYSEQKIDGIHVHYLPVKYKNSFGFLRRMLSFLLFAHKAYYFSSDIPSLDFAYITSTPLTVGLVALKLKKKHLIPYIFEVRDLWPEIPIKMGLLRNPVLKYISRYLEKKIYTKASKLIVLSPGIEHYIKGFQLNTPIFLFPNMSDCNFFSLNQSRDKYLIDQFDSKQKFIISYFGSIGRSNALEYLLNIAFISEKEDWDIIFLIIGDGAMREKLVKIAMTKGLKKVHFIKHLNKFELLKYLSVTDAAYISFANFPVLENSSPNKFFDALASGKLIISNTGGWIRELIEEYACGIYYHPEKSRTFFDQIKPFLQDPGRLREVKKNARKLAEMQFDRHILTEKLMKCLEI